MKQKKLLRILLFFAMAFGGLFSCVSSSGAAQDPAAGFQSQTKRTTPELTADGIPVDVSPFLLNKLSIINPVSSTERQYRAAEGRKSPRTYAINSVTPLGASNNVIAGIQTTVTGSKPFSYYELDATVAFTDANKIDYSFQRTYGVCAKTVKAAKTIIEKGAALYDAAWHLELDPANKANQRKVKKLKVSYQGNPRTSAAKYQKQYTVVFSDEIEAAEHQFDVEVRFEKTASVRKLPPVYATFNNIYKSNLTIAGVAAVDVQHLIWEEAERQGHKKEPSPAVNFVKAIRITPNMVLVAAEKPVEETPVATKLVEPMYIVPLEGKSATPYTVSELKKLVQDRAVNKETLVSLEEDSLWIKASAVKDLEETFAALPEEKPKEEIPTFKYYVAIGDERRGPFAFTELKEQAEGGMLTRDNLVWKSGMARWIAAGEVEDFNAIFADMPPDMPGGAQPAQAAAQPARAASSYSYYAYIDGQNSGPYGAAELTALVRDGRFTRTTFVWKEGMAGWAEASTVAEISDVFPVQESSYYVALNGQTTGPFPVSQLRQQAQAGTFSKTSNVWKEGMAGWATAGTVEELTSVFQ
jgi:hypothetical protein